VLLSADDYVDGPTAVHRLYCLHAICGKSGPLCTYIARKGGGGGKGVIADVSSGSKSRGLTCAGQVIVTMPGLPRPPQISANGL